jgi:hypothetical protein
VRGRPLISRSASAGRCTLLRRSARPYGRSFRCAPAAALKSGADVSVIVRLDAKVKTAISSISSIPEDAWSTIEYTDAVNDEQTSRSPARCHIHGPAGVSMA